MGDWHIKGSAIQTVLAASNTPGDEALRVRVDKNIPHELRDAYRTLSSHHWYPIEYAGVLLRSIYEAHESHAEADAALRACGYALANAAATTFMRLLLKILTPRLLVAKANELWRRYHDFGECLSELVDEREGQAIVRAPAYEGLHMIGAGWVERSFHLSGAATARVEHNGASGQILVPEVVWTIYWS